MKTVLRRWWWIPLVVLGVLFLKAWIVAGMLQNTAQGLAATAAGIPEERVEIHDGFDVRLTGFTDQAELDQAVADVDALDSSWNVVGVLDEAAAPAVEQPETTEAPAVVAAGPAALTLAAAAGGAVVLDGTVASEEVRTALVDQAGETFGAANVTDNLVIDPDAVAPEGGVMTITGLADDDDQRQEWIAGAGLVADEAGLRLIDEVEVAEAPEPTVEQQLNALFELEPIEFDTSRATIRSTSEATLDRAAEVINNNPEAGRLRVVGHTDSDGGEADNLDLSQRRAQAVLDYLVNVREVDAGRLEAEGRGETELKVDPETTPEDKQRNRRIEWELIS